MNRTHLTRWERPESAAGQPRPDMPKGTRTRVLVDAAGGKYSAIICCPVCGGTAYLPHDVDAQGVVTPSAVCPKVSVGRCTWHEFIVLDGWPP